MRYKHIVTVGTLLLTTLILLAAVMYYFNQDKCPVGTFACKNSTLCIPQRNWCNNIEECPEGDDESDECADFSADWNLLIKQISSNSNASTPNRCQMTNQKSYKECIYTKCTVVCTQFPDIDIPQTFSENITVLTFNSSFLPVLKSNYFNRYPSLQIVNLQNNKIHSLETYLFINQTKLTWLILSNNRITEIYGGHLVGLTSLQRLIAENNKIHTLDLKDLENNTKLTKLDFARNMLTSSNISIPYLPGLRELNLEENHLDMITDDMFSHLPMLSSLYLEANDIKYVSAKAFRNLHNLKELNLMFNKIAILEHDLFISNGKLLNLLIGNNEIEVMPMEALYPLQSNLQSLNVEHIKIEHAEKNLFSKFKKLQYLYFSKFHYCAAYAPNVKVCKPVTDGVSSLTDLLGKPLFRAAVWGISSVTCLGNALVLWGRFTARDENRVLSIIIRNLAVSDMLMGVYLFIIGLEDIRFRDNYNQEANTWISSWSCTLTGIIAMISSEVSVLILSFMSIERFMLIAAPLKGHRAITPQTAASSMIVVWVIGITLALIPAIHWRSSTRFYGLNGMCFPLHIVDPYLVGWEYSAFIFLGLNLFGLITIGYVYAGMFVSIWRTRHATPLSVGDSEFALRFFMIVLTDALCWAPIIILKIVAFFEYPIAHDLHAWVVIFILPVNSAFNPLLYTFTTPKFRERLSEGWFSKVRNIVSNRQSRSGSQVSNSLNNKNSSLSVPLTLKLPCEKKVSKPSINETLLINIMSKEK